MTNKIEWRRIVLFVALSFAIAWGLDLVIYFNGGILNSPEIAPSIPFYLPLLTVTMFAPTIAHVLTRFFTKEGWQGLWLQPHIKRSWSYWLLAWFGSAGLILLGAVVYFVLFPARFDPSLSIVQEQLTAMETQTGTPIPLSPMLFVVAQLLAGIFLSPINSFATFGEEWGWRGYLQPKLMPLGKVKAMILMGIIWGVWHAPVIAMGYNYGVDYFGYPIVGILAMMWFTFIVGTFLGWATERAGSVWPAVIGHAVVNGLASVSVMFLNSEPDTLFGPMPLGVIALLPWTLISLWILWRWQPAQKTIVSKEETPTALAPEPILH